MTPLDPVLVEEAPPRPPSQDERTTALLLWLVNLVLHVIGPWIVWWVMGKESKFVAHHAKACINYTLTLFVLVLILLIPVGVVCGALLLLDDLSTLPLWLVIAFCVIGGLLLLAVPVLGLFALVIHIIAALKANAGEWYTPPLCWRFMK
jgi:uncharacterized Tic20 family protein